jgi:integrase-like protein
MVHVHRGKGAKDRFVPLPESTLKLLRRHWASHRHPRLLFPAVGRGRNHAASAAAPLPKSSVQGAFRQAKTEAGIGKRGLSVHTLRHSYATHLLEAGVNSRASSNSTSATPSSRPPWSTCTSPASVRRTPMPASTRLDGGPLNGRPSGPLPPLCPRVSQALRQRGLCRAASGYPGHWRVPHRGTRLGVLSLRGLRLPAHRPGRLRQPPLPSMPAPQGTPVARPPARAPTTGTAFHAHFHRARSPAGVSLPPSARRLRGAVRGLLTVHQDSGARFTLRRRRPGGLLRRAPYVGPPAPVPSPQRLT